VAFLARKSNRPRSPPTKGQSAAAGHGRPSDNHHDARPPTLRCAPDTRGRQISEFVSSPPNPWTRSLARDLGGPNPPLERNPLVSGISLVDF
jgi:hypothetical protein